MDEGYTVGRLAAIARVTVRTLPHYDRIGLLSP
ncbi:MAG: MerR family DNA-binding transcriptional regulator, partial [Kitasatospora sp.]|nr:MerR family DNA-binding transcriptional regulator [Kitasatospora sp.]